MAFWEYSAVMGIIDSKGSTSEWLNKMGEAEWELIGVTPTGYGIYDFKPFTRNGNEQFGIYYFKRPAQRKGIWGAALEKIRLSVFWGRRANREPAPDQVPGTPQPTHSPPETALSAVQPRKRIE